MLKFSFHNHTYYSDGENSPEEMIAAAGKAGYTHYAFTDHIYSEVFEDWTMDYRKYDEYVQRIEKIKKDCEGAIKIYTGIEADWYKNHATHFSRFEQLRPKLDFVVGAVHVLMPCNDIYLIDGSAAEYELCLHNGYAGDADAMAADYYETYLQMIEGLKPDLLAHVDIMRKNNLDGVYYDNNAPFIRQYRKQIAEAIKAYDLVTEINGGGNYRYKNDVWYPSDAMFEELLKCEVKMTVGLDAHSVDMLTSYYDASLLKLAKAGFKVIYYYEDGEWLPIKLNELI